jgi:hypothetical protein
MCCSVGRGNGFVAGLRGRVVGSSSSVGWVALFPRCGVSGCLGSFGPLALLDRRRPPRCGARRSDTGSARPAGLERPDAVVLSRRAGGRMGPRIAGRGGRAPRQVLRTAWLADETPGTVTGSKTPVKRPNEGVVFGGWGVPISQMGTVPIEFFEPSIGALYRRIGQKSDLEAFETRRTPLGAGSASPTPSPNSLTSALITTVIARPGRR